MLIQDILGNVYDGGTLSAMARIVDWSNTPLTRAHTTGISYTIYNTATNSIPTGHNNVSLTVANVLYDTMQTTSIWTADDTGYNFLHTPDITVHPAFAGVGNVFLVVYTILPVTGQPIIVRFRINVI